VDDLSEGLAVDVVVDGGRVPCVAWLPAVESQAPVVMLGHGGSSTMRSARHERLGRWFAEHGIASLAIDGPFHGQHIPAPLPPREYQRLMIEGPVDRIIEGMVQDWQLALAALATTARVAPDRCAYVGLSLGSRFGIPLAARLGADLQCAVFGKFGLEQSPLLPPALHTPGLIRRSAEVVTAPVLLTVRWDDELFPREGALALFDAFASSDKTLLARPGKHAGSHPQDESLWRTFIADHLTI
jgi:pimeloyl-ACP methyl ester carboxylesterase